MESVSDSSWDGVRFMGKFNIGVLQNLIQPNLYPPQNRIKRNTFAAFRETHPGVRLQLFSTVSRENMKFHDLHRNFKKIYISHEIHQKRLWHLKVPKKPIGLIYVFGPRPAGPPLLPKSNDFHPISPKWM